MRVEALAVHKMDVGQMVDGGAGGLGSKRRRIHTLVVRGGGYIHT
jgi:hypothetical protein